MNHTKEPWIAEGTVDSCHISGQTVVRQNDMTPIAYFAYDGDAKRAVACVSACAGIENPEDLPLALAALSTLVDALGASNRPHELEGWGLDEKQRNEICRLALLGKERE